MSTNLIVQHFARDPARKRAYKKWYDWASEHNKDAKQYVTLDEYLKANPKEQKEPLAHGPAPELRDPTKPTIDLSEGDKYLIKTVMRKPLLVIYGKQGSGKKSAIDAVAKLLNKSVYELTYGCVAAAADKKEEYLKEARKQHENDILLISEVKCSNDFEANEIAILLNKDNPTHLFVTTSCPKLAVLLGHKGWLAVQVPLVSSDTHNGKLLPYIAHSLQRKCDAQAAVYNALQAMPTSTYTFGQAYRLVDRLKTYANRKNVGNADIEAMLIRLMTEMDDPDGPDPNWRSTATEQLRAQGLL